jgi:FAD-dependent oxidoreductase domain-containing protein 1
MNYDIVIIGGGVIGSSIAYHLAAAGESRVLVIERDPAYRQASSALSVSSIRQQFHTPTCIRMSKYGFEFLSHVSEHLGVDGQMVALPLVERGYLYLADAPRAPALKAALAIQRSLDVPVRAFDKGQLAAEFSWLATDDLELGALGTRGEGWFDGYSLLQAFRRKAINLGVSYLADEAVGLKRVNSRTWGVALATGATIGTEVVVNAAGPHSARVAEWCGFQIPVVPERRCVFTFTCPTTLDFIPLIVDPSGLYVRPEGSLFITGGPATPIIGPDPLTLEVDYRQFDEFIWPTLARRIPAFEQIRMNSAWAGHYEMNVFDHNALIGWVPGIEGCMMATGFSGHGMQHSPAAGRGVSELIREGRFATLDLSELSPQRLIDKKPIVELNVI